MLISSYLHLKKKKDKRVYAHAQELADIGINIGSPDEMMMQVAKAYPILSHTNLVATTHWV